MAFKVPYYYSELQGKDVPGPEVENNLSETPANVPDTPTHGFYNPLLAIEPDISMDATEALKRMNVSQKKKRKKKKKKGKETGQKVPVYGQANPVANGVSTDSPSIVPPKKRPSFFLSKLRHDQRRNSEPNLYEEIPDSFKEYSACYSGSLGGFSMAQRRRSSGYFYGSGRGAGSASNEVLNEVNEVQRRHNLILENLNLDVETMLMPTPSGCTEQTQGQSFPPSQNSLEKKYEHGRGDAHECYSTCWQSNKPSQRRGNEYIFSQADLWNIRNGAAGQNNYYKHGYNKGALRSADSIYKVRHLGEPLYMLYDDAHRQQLLFCRGISEECNSDNIYEEVDHAYCKQVGNCSDDGISFNSSTFCENDLGQSESEEELESGSGVVSFTQKIIGKGNKRKKKKDSEGLTSGFTRWFSTRKKEYELEKLNKMNIRPLSEDGYIDIKLSKKQRPPLSLPPPPPGLKNVQMKRRYIIASIVDSENNYVNSLQRLIRDYKRPLEETNQPIVSPSKISIMFYRVEQILQCHNMFGIALTQCVREWDFSERIGDVFVASFSKGMVLDIYSDFINNFSLAMETAKQASKNKSAFADFLKVKQMTSHDRLSFFGLMVKPVQRFPQFILLLQDLLKHTQMGHHDRMALQLALTRLECLADALNERKRESEQHHAVKDILKNLGNKFSPKPVTEGKHYLLRQDNMVQLDMDQSGMIIKSKGRRIYLLNDLLVCVSVTRRSSDGMSGGERLTLKWAVPLQEVEVQEDVAPATKNLLASSEKCRHFINKNQERNSDGSVAVQMLYDDLSDLVHDLEVMSRISALVQTLRRPYEGLSSDTLGGLSYSIQEAIRKKDEEITVLDSSCLQLVVPTKARSAKEILCFQMASPGSKRDWTTDLHLTKLAMDQNNTPAWDTPDQEQIQSRKMPLFAKAFPLLSSNCNTEVKCGCYYTIYATNRRAKRLQSLLCLCSSDGVNSQITVMSVFLNQIKKIGTVGVNESRIHAMEAVPSYYTEMGFKDDILCDADPSLPGLRETIWIGTDSRRVIVVDGQQPMSWQEIGALTVAAAVQCIKYHFQHVFIALANGCVLIFYRNADGGWLLQMPHIVTLGTSPVTSLLPLGHTVYCACGFKVWVLDAITREVQRSYTLQHENEGEANFLAHSGTGLWISLQHSATVCLYHTETFYHLQDINIAASVNRLLESNNMEHVLGDNPILVTTLLAIRGLLWVGTNVGITVTIPLPRLEGVPIITGQTNVAYHAHSGPVGMLLSLQQRTFPIPCESMPPMSPVDEEKPSSPFAHPKILKQKSDSLLPSNWSGKKAHGHQHRHSLGNVHSSGAKTLPRGMTFYRQPHHIHDLIGESNDVYGLYADLMNVQDYEKDSQEKLYERLNQSDPELVNFHLTTLDRRLQNKRNRPRSWDLSNMAVSEDSDSSAASSTVTAVVSDPGQSLQDTHTLPANETSKTAPKATQGFHRNVAKLEPTQKTVLVLTGGSGYINWKNLTKEELKTHRDAHVVVWEMKL